MHSPAETLHLIHRATERRERGQWIAAGNVALLLVAVLEINTPHRYVVTSATKETAARIGARTPRAAHTPTPKEVHKCSV